MFSFNRIKTYTSYVFTARHVIKITKFFDTLYLIDPNSNDVTNNRKITDNEKNEIKSSEIYFFCYEPVSKKCKYNTSTK